MNNNTTGSGTQGNNNTGSSNPSTGGGTSTGGSVGTSGTGSGGVNTINGPTLIDSPPPSTTIVEIGTITVNSSPFDINVEIFGGAMSGPAGCSGLDVQIIVDGTLYNYNVDPFVTETNVITVNTTNNSVDYTIEVTSNCNGSSYVEFNLVP